MKRSVLSFGLVASLLALFLFVFASCLAFGQAEAGTIVGSVHDATGAVVSGATVTVKSVGTGAERTAVTGNIGQYSIPSLAPAKYEVTIHQQGFSDLQEPCGGNRRRNHDGRCAIGGRAKFYGG